MVCAEFYGGHAYASGSVVQYAVHAEKVVVFVDFFRKEQRQKFSVTGRKSGRRFWCAVAWATKLVTRVLLDNARTAGKVQTKIWANIGGKLFCRRAKNAPSVSKRH